MERIAAARAPAINQTFAREEVAIPVKCNVHPWMKAYIAVVGSPYFKVTGKDGSFTIGNVPPGTYTVSAWHESLRHPGTDGHHRPEGIQVRHHDVQVCRSRPTKLQDRRIYAGAALQRRPCAQSSMNPPRALRNVHRFAVFTACCTFLLLIAGALVTSNDAGLSVPDWPLSYGSLLPPMVGGIFYEHGHRMIATLVGILSIVLAVWLWRVESRRWVRWLGVAALGGSDRPRHPRRHDRAVLSATADFRRSRHPRAAFLLHPPEHRLVHQRLVGAGAAG